MYPCVAILQVIIIAKLCQSCPGLGLLEEERGRLGRGPGRGQGPFISSTNCHSRFVGLPLKLLLKTLLMLRESGRSGLGAAPPQSLPTVSEATARSTLSMPEEGVCCVRAIEADGQSGWFNLCDLVSLSSCPGQTAGPPWMPDWVQGELGGKRPREAEGAGAKELLTGWCP